MSFTDCKISDSEIKNKNVKSAPDRLTGTSAENKNIFDRVPELIAGKHNDLIEALLSYADGESAGAFIGSEPINGIMQVDSPDKEANTVREQIRSLQKNIKDIVAGIIPDGSISTEKIQSGAVTPAKASPEIAKTYVMGRPPVNDADTEYEIGSEWYIPTINLNNLFKSPSFEEISDWSISNASYEVTDHEITLTGGNGAEDVILSQTVENQIGDDIYIQFDVTLLDITDLKHIAIEVIDNNETKVVETITETENEKVNEIYGNIKIANGTSAKIEVKISYIDAASAYGKAIKISKPCALNKTKDFSTSINKNDIENNYLHEAVVLMSEEKMFSAKEYIHSDRNFKKISNSVWRESYCAKTLKLSEGAKEKYGISENEASVETALEKNPPASYLAFVTNANTDSLDAAFGKNNEEDMQRIGRALAMYAWFKGDSKEEYPFTVLKKLGTLKEIFSNPDAFVEALSNDNVSGLMKASTFASSMIYTGKKAKELYNAEAMTFSDDFGNFVQTALSCSNSYDSLTYTPKDGSADGEIGGVMRVVADYSNTRTASYTSQSPAFVATTSKMVIENITLSVVGGYTSKASYMRIRDSENNLIKEISGGTSFICFALLIDNLVVGNEYKIEFAGTVGVKSSYATSTITGTCKNVYFI